MAKAKDVEKQLKNLPIGEYELIDIIKIIVSADEYQKEGLFDRSPYGRLIKTKFEVFNRPTGQSQNVRSSVW